MMFFTLIVCFEIIVVVRTLTPKAHTSPSSPRKKETLWEAEFKIATLPGLHFYFLYLKE